MIYGDRRLPKLFTMVLPVNQIDINPLFILMKVGNYGALIIDKDIGHALLRIEHAIGHGVQLFK